MQDPRIATLAKNLIRYSVRLQPGEKVLIDTVGYELPLTKALIRAAYQVGGQPYLNISHDDLLAALLEGASPGQIRQTAQWEAQRMAAMDAYIGIRVQDNSFALARDVYKRQPQDCSPV